MDGDGKQTRDFTFVKNVVDANIRAALAGTEFKGDVINVACGKAYSVLDIVDVLNKLLKKSIKPQFGPVRQGDVRKTHADIGLLKKKLGLVPKITFEEGLKRTLDWFQSREVKLS